MAMRFIMILLISSSLYASIQGERSLPNPYSSVSGSEPFYFGVGRFVSRRNSPRFDITDLQIVPIAKTSPLIELFSIAVTRELKPDTIMMSSQTSVLLFMDREKRPIAGFLYEDRARENINVLEPILVQERDGKFSYRLMSRDVAAMQGVDLDGNLSVRKRNEVTSLRFIPIMDFVEKYAGADSRSSFPRSLVSAETR